MRRNEGAYLDESVQICEIGQPNRTEAVLIIDEGDIDLITVGQPVAILLDAFTSRTFEGTIAKIADSEYVSPAAKQTNAASDAEQPPPARYSSYLAQVQLPNDVPGLRSGLHGQAKIYAVRLTLAQRLSRFVQRTFRFEL